MTQDSKGREVIPSEFPRITLNELLPGDAILFIGGNKLTEFHGKYRRKEFGRSDTPPYHEAMVYVVSQGIDPIVMILDPVALTSFQDLNKYMKHKESRIDIIRYNLTDEQRKICQEAAEVMTSKVRIYDTKGYGAFISQMPLLGWVKHIIKPSETKFYCSDGVTYCIQDRAGYIVSPRDHNFTAPVDSQVYAINNPDRAQLRTLKLRGE